MKTQKFTCKPMLVAICILVSLLFSCQGVLIQSGNAGLRIQFQGIPPSLLANNSLSSGSSVRGLLTNGGKIHVIVNHQDGSGINLFDQDVSISLNGNGQAEATATIPNLPLNTALQLLAEVRDGSNRSMFSATSIFTLNGAGQQTIALAVLPVTNYPGILPVTISGMSNITLNTGVSSIFRLIPTSSQVNLPFVLSWGSLPNPVRVSIVDSFGNSISQTLIENGKSGVRFVPTSTTTYYLVISSGGAASQTLQSLSGFSGEKMVYTSAAINSIVLPTTLVRAVNITAKAWGAGGSGSRYLYSGTWTYGSGGGGGYSTASFTASAGNTIIAIVGEEGHFQAAPSRSQPASGGTSSGNGSGGGGSLVTVNNSGYNGLWVCAGGGGGGFAGSDRYPYLIVSHNGGAGGGNPGSQDDLGVATGGYDSGSLGSGGSSPGYSGVDMVNSIAAAANLNSFGGTGGNSGGGGGGGGYGGGGGGSVVLYSNSGGAGGGGYAQSGTTNPGSGTAPANANPAVDTDYGFDSAGTGGSGAVSDGMPGRVVLYIYY